MAWKVINHQIILDRPPYLRVRQEQVEVRPGQVIDDFYQVDLVEFAMVIPFLENGKVLVIRQYKHGPRKEIYGFPAGLLDPGEAPDIAARRELLEETGLEAPSLQGLGHFINDGNQGCGGGHYFYATGCRRVARPDPGDLEDFAYLELTPDEITQAIRAGQFAVIHHAAAWGLWTMLGQR
ncbi:NUDIX hydrolase [Pseudoprimorskyibacter insulae]|uniref:Methanol dehydrogenase activator n=1 Tax=Pseudoprimorskyibacter insulae TaxID=1695997 RepID=A0A2R8B122_9RHOB|nr:NUDIX hydrolase [Pseudoprimorskyibacter insulae]SPF81789.1 Methanol dehydrogenase activator [Pseudoprimorskyibacter insulae]